MTLGIFATAFEKRSLPPYTKVRWRGMIRCGALESKRKKEWSSKQVSRVALYASAPIAYDGAVYARVEVAIVA